MKHRELFIKRVLTGFAVGLGLLAGALLVSGIALRGPAGLNLFALGLALAPLAVGAVILRLCLLLLVNKIKTSTKWITPTIKAKGHDTRPLHSSNNIKPRNMAIGSVLAVVSNVEEQEEISETEETDYLNPPRESIAAHFNWATGEIDDVRGLDGIYDPPYDLTKG